MNSLEAIAQSLQTKSDEEVFYFFKHDGHLDFSTRLAAGKTLRSRNYNPAALKEEKFKIVNELQTNLNQLNSKSEIEAEQKKEAASYIKVEIMLSLLFILLILIFQVFIRKKDFSDFNSILPELVTIVAFAIITSLNYRRRVNKGVNQALKDREQYKLRLNAIEKEWDF